MPQLDKVTFLSQFFWLCIVFISMYLILVKFFLPALARIVKLRQSLKSTSIDSNDVNHSSNNPINIYKNSIDASLQAFQSNSQFLSAWNSIKFKNIVGKIFPKFNNDLTKIRIESLLAENLLNRVLPPVGLQQSLVFDNSSHTKWFTAKICSKINSKGTGNKDKDLNKKKK